MDEFIPEVIYKHGRKRKYFDHRNDTVKCTKMSCEDKCVIPKGEDQARDNLPIRVENSDSYLQEQKRIFEDILQKTLKRKNTNMECSKELNTSNDTNQVCGDIGLYLCDICFEIFETQEGLDKHDLIHANQNYIGSYTWGERSVSDTESLKEGNVGRKTLYEGKDVIHPLRK